MSVPLKCGSDFLYYKEIQVNKKVNQIHYIYRLDKRFVIMMMHFVSVSPTLEKCTDKVHIYIYKDFRSNIVHKLINRKKN